MTGRSKRDTGLRRRTQNRVDSKIPVPCLTRPNFWVSLGSSTVSPGGRPGRDGPVPCRAAEGSEAARRRFRQEQKHRFQNLRAMARGAGPLLCVAGEAGMGSEHRAQGFSP